MRILITTGIFRPDIGGPATFCLEFAKRLGAAGHAVKVITYSDKPSYDVDSSTPFPLTRIVRSQGRPWSKLSNYFRFFLAVRRAARGRGTDRGADIIYTLDWFSAGVPVWLAATFLKKKYIVRVGGGYIWEKYLSEGQPPLSLKQFYETGLHKNYRLMRFLISRVLQNAAFVVFNSDEQRYLYQRYYELIPPKTVTIFNATPEYKVGNLLQSFRGGERSVPEKEFVFAGRFIKMKNIESLIQAFARVNDPSFMLLLIGDGPEEQPLRNLAASLGLSDRVVFKPAMAPAELFKTIANSYCFVLPSWTDVSPNQAFECFTIGIPLLLTKENYLPSKVKPATMIDPHSVADIAEKMNLLLDDGQYENFLKAQSGLTYKHSWTEVLGEHMAVFGKVVSR